MRTERRARRVGLGTKLDIMLIACILAIALGFVRITYGVYCRKVDSKYFERAERAVIDIVYNHTPDGFSANLRKMIDTDEFREVRTRAVAANDEQIIEDWMLEKPSDNVIEGRVAPDFSQLTEEEKVQYTLYGDYLTLITWTLPDAEDIFDVDVYIQYVVDGVTYNLADPDMSLLDIGTAEEPIEALARYTGNDRIPPTIYQFRGDWLCTACEPILDEWDSNERVPVAQMCVDINMNDVVRERHWFLVNSAVFIALLTLAVMAVTLLLTRRLAATPLKQLAEGTAKFEMGDEGFSRDDVIDLPIRSNDEIGDLYHQIKAMQVRIVDDADALTRATAKRERVNTELNMAAHIQTSVLPRKFPAFPDRPEFDLYASMDPAKEVGGDFYDFFLVDDDHLALVIADVSDKGVPAALFMMSAKIILKYRARMGGAPGEILTSVNAQLCGNNPTGMFVTVWLGILELSTGRLTCTNAGHEYPVVRENGRFRILTDPHGLPLGIMSGMKYRDYTISLRPGDAVFVYTDGVSEANNAEGELYTRARLEMALNQFQGNDPEGILKGVRADVDAFVKGAVQFDDLTMLCLEYRGPKKAE